MSQPAFEHEHDADVLVTPIRRRPRRRRSAYTRPPTDIMRVILSLLVLVALVGGALYYLYNNMITVGEPYALIVNGKTLAIVRSRQDADRAILALKCSYAPANPAVVQFVQGDPLIRPVGKRMRVLAPDAAVAPLKKYLTPVFVGYAIFVNHTPRVLLASQEEGWQTISMMMDLGMGNKQGIPTFKQRVTIAHLMQNPATAKHLVPIMNPQQAAAELVHPPRQRVHIVDNGDNFWKIATESGITVDDLKALNPNVSTLLHKGDVIKLPDEPSVVTVVVRQVTTPQPIAQNQVPPPVVTHPAPVTSLPSSPELPPIASPPPVQINPTPVYPPLAGPDLTTPQPKPATPAHHKKKKPVVRKPQTLPPAPPTNPAPDAATGTPPPSYNKPLLKKLAPAEQNRVPTLGGL